MASFNKVILIGNLVADPELKQTPVLGINAPVTIGHGKSTPLAIKNLVLATERTIKSNVTAKMQEAFKA